MTDSTEINEEEDRNIVEVHAHVLPEGEKRTRHYFIGVCPCNPIIEIEQDEDGDEVTYLYHNVVH